MRHVLAKGRVTPSSAKRITVPLLLSQQHSVNSFLPTCRLGNHKHQRYPFGIPVLLAALLQGTCNSSMPGLSKLWVPGSRIRARAVSTLREIKPNPSTPTSSTEKAMTVIVLWKGRGSSGARDDLSTNTTEDKGHYNTATSCDKTLKGGSEDFYLTVLGCSKDGLCLCLKGEEKKRNKERKFKSDIENENELNADDKLAGHALAAQSTFRKHAASFSLQP